jgi:hypothetical protein
MIPTTLNKTSRKRAQARGTFMGSSYTAPHGRNLFGPVCGLVTSCACARERGAVDTKGDSETLFATGLGLLGLILGGSRLAIRTV